MTTLDSPSFDTPIARDPDLQFNITVSDLYRRDGLLRLDQTFLDYLNESDASLHEKLKIAREQPDILQPKDESALLIEVAAWLDDFIAKLFNIETEINALAAKHHELAPLYFCKRQFVQRRAKGKVSADELAVIDGMALEKELAAEFDAPFSELIFATHVAQWMEDEVANETRLKKALHYAAWALRTPEGQAHTQAGILFKSPAKLDFQHLLALETDESNGFPLHRLGHLRQRNGFALTDQGTDLVGALDEANYCIW